MRISTYARHNSRDLCYWISQGLDRTIRPHPDGRRFWSLMWGMRNVGRRAGGLQRLTVVAAASLAGLGMALAQAPAASPEDARRRLEAGQRQLDDTKKRAGEIQSTVGQLNEERDKLNARLVETAKQVQASEAQMSGIEARLGELEAQEKLVRGSLEQRHESISKLLAAMQSMGRNPPPVMITKREDALSMVRSAMLLAAAFPNLRKDALALAEQLNDLVRVMTDIRTESEKLKVETVKLNDARIRIAGLMEAKKQSLADRQEELSQVRRAAAEISRNVTDLSELISKLDQAVSEKTALGAYDRQIAAEQQKQAPPQQTAAATPPVVTIPVKPAQPPPSAVETPPTAPAQVAKAPEPKTVEIKLPEARPATELLPSGERTAMAAPGRIKPALPFHLAKGRLSLPAQGRRVLAFGEKNQYGNVSKGMVVETRNSAQVTAPADGWVVYAGDFRSYGPLLIINAGGGYHLLLAGLAQIDVQVGQFVSSGEPVGLMAAAKAPQAGKQANGPVLYIEFKKDGQSIDPGPWWADGSQKVQG
jgi:murein hydrolase activator